MLRMTVIFMCVEMEDGHPLTLLRPLPLMVIRIPFLRSQILNMILAILSFLAGLTTGVLVMRKHSARASELEAKGRAALDALKGR